MLINENFKFSGMPNNVYFGAGSVEFLLEEIRQKEWQRMFIVASSSTEQHAKKIASGLGDTVFIFPNAKLHIPISITKTALNELYVFDPDVILAIGGGAAIGLGKALTQQSFLPLAVVPTTFSGSEMTDILGETHANHKTVRRHSSIRPQIVSYDMNFIQSLPGTIAFQSGVNAIAHGIEAIYAQDTNPFIRLIAKEGVQHLFNALPNFNSSHQITESRAEALYGAWLCGMVLNSVEMGLQHKLSHILGGDFNLHHGAVHTILLPHVIAFNEDHVGNRFSFLVSILDNTSVGQGLFDFLYKNKAPLALKDLGLKTSNLQEVVDLLMSTKFFNPRPFNEAEILSLLQMAYYGERPEGKVI